MCLSLADIQLRPSYLVTCPSERGSPSKMRHFPSIFGVFLWTFLSFFLSFFCFFGWEKGGREGGREGGRGGGGGGGGGRVRLASISDASNGMDGLGFLGGGWGGGGREGALTPFPPTHFRPSVGGSGIFRVKTPHVEETWGCPPPGLLWVG